MTREEYKAEIKELKDQLSKATERVAVLETQKRETKQNEILAIKLMKTTLGVNGEA